MKYLNKMGTYVGKIAERLFDFVVLLIPGMDALLGAAYHTIGCTNQFHHPHLLFIRPNHRSIISIKLSIWFGQSIPCKQPAWFCIMTANIQEPV
jgi:hypothetical protein